MIKKSVLLLAPPYMDIYKDIISCMESMNYNVTWIKDGQIKGNPYNKHNINRHTKNIQDYDREVTVFWQRVLDNEFKDLKFDYFLAIDGLMVSKSFLNQLTQHSPGIKKVLFLYDRVENNYELDCFFPCYDSIFTFDLLDSNKYGIHHLPIYWIPSVDSQEECYDIFGMASYKAGDRYRIFKQVRNVALAEGLHENIRLWHAPIKNRFKYTLKHFINRLRGRFSLSLTELNGSLFTEQLLSPDEFRRVILSSKAILDTHNSYQDGLTARFMWALGAEKKILTTNPSAKEYPFYDSRQVFIIEDIERDVDNMRVFLQTPYHMPDSIREMILPYRIDNWIKTLFDVCHEKCK